MSTVAEIKQALTRLPDRQKIKLARWLQTQVGDRLNDDELMKIAAEGARALDKRESETGLRQPAADHESSGWNTITVRPLGPKPRTPGELTAICRHPRGGTH